MYDAIEYWTKRLSPNPYDHVRDIEIDDLKPFIDESETILDYGVGNGRLMPLYERKKVTGVDIVDTYKTECIANADINEVYFSWRKDIVGEYDLGVCTKVILHEPHPEYIIRTLAKHCDKVFISTAINQNAPHVFNHDYKELLKDYEIEFYREHGNELHIVYKK